MQQDQKPVHVLIVEQNEEDVRVLQDIMGSETTTPFAIDHVSAIPEAAAFLNTPTVPPIDVILMGLFFPDSQGIDSFVRMQSYAPRLPIVVLSNVDDEDLAMQIVHEGAEDYLSKQIVMRGTEWCAPLVSRSLRYAIERHRLRTTVQESMRAAQMNEQRLRTIIEKNADGIIIVDMQGIVRFLNPAGETMFGRRADELVDYSFGFPMVAGEQTEMDVFRRDGQKLVAEMRVVETEWESEAAYLATFRDISERKQAEARRMTRFAVTSVLAQAATLWNAIPNLLRAICEGERWELGEMWLVDAESRVLRWAGWWHMPSLPMESYEEECRTITFVPSCGLHGRVWSKGYPEWVRDVLLDTRIHQAPLLVGHGLTSGFAFPILNGDGVIGVMAFFGRSIPTPDDDIIKMVTDIGNQIGQFIARKRAEEDLRSAHRALRTLNECNQSLIHASDESAFLRDICRIIVEVGGYRLAWAGFVKRNEKDQSIRLVAQAGYEEGNVRTIDITWTNSGKGYGPTHTAIRTGTPCVAKNILNDSTYASWHEHAARCGFASSVALPLMVDTQPFGVLNIYSKQPDSFGKEEVKLLMEMANDLAYGIIALRTRAERDRAEKALRLYTERLKNMREIDQAILTAQTSEAIAQAALSHIRRLVPYQWASIVGFDLESGQPVTLVDDVKCSDDEGGNFAPPGTRLPLIVPSAPEGIHQGNARYIEDITALTSRPPAVQELLDLGIRSYISAPLIADGQLIGEINLGAITTHAFHKQHLSIAHEVADQLAVAIHHARLFEQVRAGRERLQILSRRLMEVQEVERHHIARELHDEIGQSLTAVKISIQAIQRIPDKSKLSAHLEESISIVDHALQHVRNLSLDLRPSLLDDLGLVAALRWYVDRQAQWGNFTAEFIADTIETRLPPDMETVCFRVTQEAVTNVVRHAQATKVRIELKQQDDEVSLNIQDDGVGFNVRAAEEHAVRGSSLGLLGMKERVLLAGGKFEIRSQPHSGTEIRVYFPIPDRQPRVLGC
jgi:signal transduction histidine kinase/PAS domain-containing protein